VRVGSSSALGKYVVLRDVFGDEFTYAGLGSVASSYRLPKPPRVAGLSAAALAAGGGSAQGAAKQGAQQPITLHVSRPLHSGSGLGVHTAARRPSSAAPPSGKVRLFAHPGNPDALAAAARGGASAASGTGTLALRA